MTDVSERIENSDKILVQALAFASALHEPLRDVRAPFWASTWRLRDVYRRSGSPYRGSAGMESSRALSELARDGLVVRRRGQRKTVGIKLTEAGLDATWRLVGRNPADALMVAGEVDRLGLGGRWVRETAFNHGRGWGDGFSAELKIVQAFHSPALVAGWMESNCDMLGRVGYRTTQAGREALVEDEGIHDSGSEPPEPDREVLDLFDQHYRESLNWLSSQDAASVGARGSIGNLPLPPTAWLETEDAYTA